MEFQCGLILSVTGFQNAFISLQVAVRHGLAQNRFTQMAY